MTALEVGRRALEPSSTAGRAEGMCIDHHIRTASLKLCERNFQRVYMRSCAGGIISVGVPRDCMDFLSEMGPLASLLTIPRSSHHCDGPRTCATRTPFHHIYQSAVTETSAEF